MEINKYYMELCHLELNLGICNNEVAALWSDGCTEVPLYMSILWARAFMINGKVWSRISTGTNETFTMQV